MAPSLPSLRSPDDAGPLRVVVADDDEVVRAAVVDLLTADGRCTVAAAVGTADDAVTAVAAHRPDVALLDVRMPGGGLAAARAIHRDHPRTTLVVLSASVDAADLADLLRAGVTGALIKGRSSGLLPDLLARCRRGEVLLLVPGAARALANLG